MPYPVTVNIWKIEQQQFWIRSFFSSFVGMQGSAKSVFFYSNHNHAFIGAQPIVSNERRSYPAIYYIEGVLVLSINFQTSYDLDNNSTRMCVHNSVITCHNVFAIDHLSIRMKATLNNAHSAISFHTSVTHQREVSPTSNGVNFMPLLSTSLLIHQTNSGCLFGEFLDWSNCTVLMQLV